MGSRIAICIAFQTNRKLHDYAFTRGWKPCALKVLMN